MILKHDSAQIIIALSIGLSFAIPIMIIWNMTLTALVVALGIEIPLMLVFDKKYSIHPDKSSKVSSG